MARIGAEAGAAPDNDAVEWSAGRRSIPIARGARAFARRAGPPDRKGGSKGPRKPLAPPGAPSPFWGNGKRETAYPGPPRLRAMTRVWRSAA